MSLSKHGVEYVHGIVVQLLNHVQHFVTPWTAARQASLSITISWSLLKLMSTELVMPSNHLILCHPLLLLSIFLASGSFLMSQLFALDSQSIGTSVTPWLFATLRTVASIHGIVQARTLEWIAILLQGIFPSQGLNLDLQHCRQILYHLSHQGSPWTWNIGLLFCRMGK